MSVAPEQTRVPGLLLGVDIGGTKIRAGLADQFGTLLAEKEQPTHAAGEGLGIQVRDLAHELRAQCEIDECRFSSVAVGGAGVALADGSLALAPNLEGVAGTDLVSDLARALDAPVVLDNDVNLAALGELHAGRVGDSFCFISFGTGVGMGIVLDGQLVTGAHGAAGEIGYLPMGADPLNPEHHVSGAYEEVVSGASLGKRVDHATPGAPRPTPAPEVFDRASGGDATARAAIDDYARWAAYGVASVVAVLDPPQIVLGGGIGRRPDLTPLIQQWLTRLGHPDVALTPSTLGPTGPVLGAIRRAQQNSLQKGLRP